MRVKLYTTERKLKRQKKSKMKTKTLGIKIRCSTIVKFSFFI